MIAFLSGPAVAQSDDSDLLAPLVDPDADLIAPLVDPDADLLAPLVDPDADLLEPLVPKKPAKRRPGKVTHKDELEIGEEQNGFILVKRKVVDPCGVFEISWGGRKTCHQTEREKWEYVAAGKKPPEEKQEEPEDEEDDLRERPPSGSPGGRGPGTGGKGPSGGPGGNGPGPGPGPRGNGSGGGPGSNPGTGPGNAPGGGRAPGKGGVVAPGNPIEARLRDFAVRPLSLRVDAQGRFDVTLTVRNVAKTAKLIANGDWTVTLTDADGLGFSSRDIWMPGSGPAKPFHLMPNVAPGGVHQIRFLIEPEKARSSLVRLSVQQGGAAPATFDISRAAVGRAAAKSAPAPSAAPFVALHKFDVRLDGTQAIGGKVELFFTARNRTRDLQYLGGSNLRFQGSSQGGPVQSRPEAFSIRGARSVPVGMAPIQPGASARLRVLFDAAGAKGPWTVTDGVKSAPLQPAGAAAAEEPQW
ncbi:hypothetical protein MZO42_08730 [Sphingomonas psychrotolerans]|uniref:Uncharacterized protein n=1 Tax=Sphingomonas psychrotolerans TaxID=1327635 RepID=A0ABU3N2S9_9SPHN|nr:hypothetical protein [Sphingomonas psychrotolerans]MDT8758782.1 hypothetical protein [Sphingomonas psychrotolerans]